MDSFRKDILQPGNFEECYAFSLHQFGSTTLMHGMIRKVCIQEGIPAIDIPGTFFDEGIADNEWVSNPQLLELIRPGFIYYGYRTLPPILLDPKVALTSKKSILLARDPRDAVVSHYFSSGTKHPSHALPKNNPQKFMEMLKKNQSVANDIDEYALIYAKRYLDRLVLYRESLDFSNVLLRKYEDVYFDKMTFLTEIFEHFKIKVNVKTLEDVARNSHIRGTPGDHKNKLRPETINKLNGMFNEIGPTYGYDFSSSDPY